MERISPLYSRRFKLQEEYCRQAESVLTQWETDIEKMKEQEDKLTVSIFIQLSFGVLTAQRARVVVFPSSSSLSLMWTGLASQ